MAAVVSLVVIVALGLLLTRVATVALTMTGMSLDHARFQARSALTGTGFTTSEAEAIVTHPVRRRVVMLLMLLSGAGALSIVGTLVLSFSGIESATGGLGRAAVIVVAVVALLWLARTRVVDAALRRGIERVLARWADLEVYDYTALLHLRGQWRVAQLPVTEDTWIASRPVGLLRLPDEGVALLGVEHADGTWTGAPTEDLRLCDGDVVVLYGRRQILDDIAVRLYGDEGDAASERSRGWHAASPPTEALQSPERRGRRRTSHELP